MAREPISIPDTAVINWAPIRSDAPEDDNVPGPLWKLLTEDRATGAVTYMTYLPPGWRDEVLDWHMTTEEGFRIGGGEGTASPPGRYLYRQPGQLHGPARAPLYEGATIIQRMSGPLRILRYNGTKYPRENLQFITDQHKTWPIDQVFVHSNELPWEDAPAGGGWAGARFKWLHRNKVNGGGAVLMDLPAGWKGTGAQARGPVEEFVVEGSVNSGGEQYVKWGYVCRAAGDPAGEYSTDEGAQLVCWWDEGSELE
jgi:hypothetical protein